VFGEALPAIMARKSEQGRDVPLFVNDLVDRILQLGGSTTVGIFRWPGADQEVKAICTAYVAHCTQRRERRAIASAWWSALVLSSYRPESSLALAAQV
jgi:hypothetical protein